MARTEDLMQKFRDWLTANKIFFEVANYLIIGSASLIVAWAALDVNEKMLYATEVAALPHFSIQKAIARSENSKNYDNEILTLANAGAPASNVEWTVRTYVVVDRFDPNKKRILIPIKGYYFWHRRSGAATGDLATYEGKNNLAHFSRLYDLALDANKTDNDVSNFVEIQSISEVRYVDRLGRATVSYFQDGRSVSESQIAKLTEKNVVPKLDISEISLNDINDAALYPDRYHAIIEEIR